MAFYTIYHLEQSIAYYSTFGGFADASRALVEFCSDNSLELSECSIRHDSSSNS